MAIAMEETVEPMQFTQVFKVTPEMIDDNHHFNNVWSVQWIQDIAIAHSDSVGGTALMREQGAGWMIHTSRPIRPSSRWRSPPSRSAAHAVRSR